MPIYYQEEYKPINDYSKPADTLSFEYRGFRIEKLKEHTLYQIVSKEGMSLAPMLRGSFTRVEIVKRQIDEWFKDQTPETSSEAAFITIPLEVKRGRPVGGNAATND